MNKPPRDAVTCKNMVLIRKKAIKISSINDTSGVICEDTKKLLVTRQRTQDLGAKPDRILKSGKNSILIEAISIPQKQTKRHSEKLD